MPDFIQKLKRGVDRGSAVINIKSKELIDMVHSGNDEAILKFIQENYSPDFLSIASLEEHSSIFKRLRQRIGNRRPSKFIQKGEILKIIFSLESMDIVIVPEINENNMISGIDIIAE